MRWTKIQLPSFKRHILVAASNAELERHFSGVGRIAHRDRNRLKDDVIESSVGCWEGNNIVYIEHPAVELKQYQCMLLQLYKF